MTAQQLFSQAADTFVDLVDRIEPTQWTRPGLGVWDLRALVGHTSRSLVTVLTYLDQPADSEVTDSPEGYYALIASQHNDPAAIAERGRQAGQALGDDPAAALHELRDQVAQRLATADPEQVITTIVGGMRLGAYLPTRIFELVVHSLDIAAATDLEVRFDADVLKAAASLAAAIAVELGQGQRLLTAVTGRTTLPSGFSVVG